MIDAGLTVLIIGAGSTGLLLAQGLKQQGLKILVYEREDPTTYIARPREWGMTLHWGASHISKCIPPDMRANLNEGICCDPFYDGEDLTIPLYNGETGEKLFDLPGKGPRRVSRRKFRHFMSQGIDVQYGKKLQDITLEEDEKVKAIFEDGTSATGSVLIGCDSAHSTVRQLLVGEEAAKVEVLDVNMFNLSCSFPKEIALLQREAHPIVKNAYHPNGTMWLQSIMDVKDPDKPETWLFQNILSWEGAPRPEDFPDQASRLQFWREKAKTYAEPWKTVGQNLSDNLQFGVDRTTVWRPVDWTNSKLAGRVTLAGDAAHAIPAHRGQGLNNAIEDAAKLVDELSAASKGEKTIAEALTAYEDEMRPRALTEIPVSIASALMVHRFDTLMTSPLFVHGLHKSQEGQKTTNRGTEIANQST